MMMARKLFQEDVYKKENESTIMEVRGAGTIEDPFLLVLDETIFFPTGGGQPCDLGTINDAPLSEVFEKEGEVFHRLVPSTEGSGKPVSWNSGGITGYGMKRAK
jgi:alanyl-tRNA synthetase